MFFSRYKKAAVSFVAALALLVSGLSMPAFSAEANYVTSGEDSYGLSATSLGLSVAMLLDSAGQAGPYRHYNGIVFDYFEAATADVEGAFAAGGKSNIGTQDSYDFGGSEHYDNSKGYIGKYQNSSLYPSLLLRNTPTLHGNRVSVYGGPVAMSAAAQKDYEALTQQISIGADSLSGYGLTPEEIAALTSGPIYLADDVVEGFFQDAYDDFSAVSQALAASQSKEVALNRLHGGWDAPNGDSLASLNAAELDQYAVDVDALGLNNVLILSFTDSGSVYIGVDSTGGGAKPYLSSHFGDYDIIVFSFPNADTANFGGDFGGQSLWMQRTDREWQELAATYAGFGLEGGLDATSVAFNKEKVSEYAQKIIWNFPRASQVNVSGTGVIGSVLAPDAQVNGKGGSINGMLVSSSFTTTNGMELHAFPIADIFNGSEPDPQPDKAQITLTKRDVGDDSLLEGAQFQLQIQDGETWSDVGRPVGTDSMGQVTFTDLEPGIYQVVETQAATGYDKDSAVYSPQSVEIRGHEWVEINATNKKENAYPATGATLVKMDEESEGLLEGAYFKLQLLQDEEWVDYLESRPTDKQGRLTVDNLGPGTYRFVETAPAPGYDMDSLVLRPETFVIEDGGILMRGGIIITATNRRTNEPGPEPEPGVGQATLLKQDGENEAKIIGAVFRLQVLENEWMDYDAPTQTTDLDGKVVFDKLPPGTYRFVETSAAAGYDKDSVVYTPREFTVEAEGGYQTFSVVATNKKLQTDPDIGQIVLTKRDAQNGDVLTGASFRLQRLEEDTWRDYTTTKSTGSDGKVHFGDLPPGIYRPLEVEAAAGYDLAMAEYTPAAVEVVEGNGAQSFAVLATNQKLPQEPKPDPDPDPDYGEVTLLKLDKDTQAALEGAEFQLQRQEDGGWANVLLAAGSTGSDGKLALDNLPAGTYRFVELSAAGGYNKESAVYSPETFTVRTGGGNRQVFTVTATNEKNKATGGGSSGGGSGGGSPGSGTTPDRFYEEKVLEEESMEPMPELAASPENPNTGSASVMRQTLLLAGGVLMLLSLRLFTHREEQSESAE